MISDEGKASLVRLVSKEEVYTTFTQMDFFKAPSTNGFQAFFFKKILAHCWEGCVEYGCLMLHACKLIKLS